MIQFDTKTKRIVREALMIGVMVIGILAGRSTLADHYYVPSGSMEYTLLPGDRVFVDKRAYGLRVPFTTIELTEGEPVRRGDVVIFDSPKTGVRLIKRIVATGGDHVRLDAGRLVINGMPLEAGPDSNIEIFDGKEVALNLRDGGGPGVDMTVGEGQVLAIGDHRGSSADGRYFGTVSEAEIYGRATAIYYRSGDGFRWSAL